MCQISQFLFATLFLFATQSCSKEDPPVTTDPDPTPTGYQQYGTPYDDIPDNEDIVLYEVNLRAFSSTGDLQGLTNRLDDLKALGVNVIWLMPIHPIGEVNSVNSPYSVKDYKAVSSEYGTLSDLRKLTDEAHARDMTVIMDWIANHTAWDNAWINNKSWYTQDANGAIIHPAGTNWMDVADLNFDNQDMREAMIDAMKYWILEANVDGFRCDYADGVPFDFWSQAIDTLQNIPNRDYVLLAEGNRINHYNAGFDLSYAWDFYGTIKAVFGGQSATTLYETHESEYLGIPAGKHKLRFTTNHDESAWDKTPMVIFNGKAGALAASVATIFMGGAPMIYSSQEVGRQGTVPFFSNTFINWEDNPDMLQAYKDILSFYNQSLTARAGTNTDYSDDDVVCFRKDGNDSDLLIVVNVRGEAQAFDVPANLQGTSWENALTGETIDLSTSLSLTAYEYLILKQ